MHLFFLLKFLLLFSYSCLHFLPIPPPHPSQTHLPSLPPPSPLVLSICPLQQFLKSCALIELRFQSRLSIGTVYFLFFLILFLITLYIQYYFVLISGVQYNGQVIVYLTKWSADIARTHLAPYIVITLLLLEHNEKHSTKSRFLLFKQTPTVRSTMKSPKEILKVYNYIKTKY